VLEGGGNHEWHEGHEWKESGGEAGDGSMGEGSASEVIAFAFGRQASGLLHGGGGVQARCLHHLGGGEAGACTGFGDG
jgi:hypothetical protein